MTNSIKNKNEMRKVYFLRFNFKANAEIYFNGILLQKLNENGISGGNYILNPYIEKSGLQNVSIKIDKFLGKTLTQGYLQEIFIEIYYSENYNEENEDFPLELLHKLTLPKYPTPQNSILNSWEFEADVNYKIKDVLSNAIDLTKENPDSLLKDVLSEYKKNYEIINSGNTNKYSDLIKHRIERETVSMYYTQREKDAYTSKLLSRIKAATGIMQPIIDYHLKIHPNKKIVTLVNSEDSSILISKNENGGTNTFALQLYRDKATGELKVY